MVDTVAPVAGAPTLLETQRDSTRSCDGEETLTFIIRPMTTGLRCPFCDARFPDGEAWREHFLSCPRRFTSKEQDQSSPISQQVKFFESQFVDVQNEIDELRKRNRDLESENRRLLQRLENIRKALS